MKEKVWDESKEEQWRELTKLREENKKEVGKLHTIHLLEDLIESLRNDDPVPHEIEIEYLRSGFGAIAIGELPPITGKRITLTYNGVPKI